MSQPTPLARLRTDPQGRTDVRSLDLPALTAWFDTELGETPGRAKKLFKQLWQQRATDFSSMVGVPKPLRERLAERLFIPTLTLDQRLRSRDGTTKYLWKLADGQIIESVLIPDDDRVTLCMSSQVGCAMACTFCLTGDMGLKRHLLASEIALQPMLVQQDLDENGGGEFGPPPGTRITNLVLMGMGEPLHNLDNLLPALRVCMDDDGLNFSHRRITVSTSGLIRQLPALAEALPVNLAVSLNATTDAQRSQIMPINKKHDLQALIQACRDFPLVRTKRIAFEYVMFAGFNDTLDDAGRILTLLDGVRAKVNLIPYNENPDRPHLKRPSDEVVKAFQHHLVSNGMNCTVRATRGIDISAACGQLGKGSF